MTFLAGFVLGWVWGARRLWLTEAARRWSNPRRAGKGADALSTGRCGHIRATGNLTQGEGGQIVTPPRPLP